MLELINELESSKEFKNWKNKNKKAFFSSAFIILDKNKDGNWQFDYYNAEDGAITSFLISDTIKIQKSEQIFKKKETKIKKFNLKDLKIKFKKALEIVNEIKKKKYPNEIIDKTIIILQHLKKPLWNITLLTNSFNIINIKLSSETGKVLSEKYESLFKYKLV